LPDFETYVLQAAFGELLVLSQPTSKSKNSALFYESLLHFELSVLETPFSGLIQTARDTFIHPLAPSLNLLGDYTISLDGNVAQTQAAPGPSILTSKTDSNVRKRFRLFGNSMVSHNNQHLSSEQLSYMFLLRGTKGPKELRDLLDRMLPSDETTLPLSVVKFIDLPVYCLAKNLFVGLRESKLADGSNVITVIHLVPRNGHLDEWIKCSDLSCPLHFDQNERYCLRPFTSTSFSNPIAWFETIVCESFHIENSWNNLDVQSRDRTIITNEHLQEDILFATLRRNVMNIPICFARDAQILAAQFSSGLTLSSEMFWTPGQRVFNAWSDASVTDSSNATTAGVSMAFAVLFPHNQEFNVRGKINSSHVSSTRAELIGVIAATLVVPSHSILNVTLDSKCVVSASKKQLDPNATPRGYLRTSCAVEWSQLRQILKFKNITLRLRWVKGHSTNYFNNLADHLAGISHNLPTIEISVPLDIRPLFVHNQVITGDCIKTLRKLPVVKNDVMAVRRLQQVLPEAHHFIDLRSLSLIFEAPRERNQISLYRFRLRGLFNLLPSLDMDHRRASLATPTFCRMCLSSVVPDARHSLLCSFIRSNPDATIAQQNAFLLLNLGVPTWRQSRQIKERLTGTSKEKQLSVANKMRNYAERCYKGIWRPFCCRRKELDMPLDRSGPETKRRPYKCIVCHGTVPQCCSAEKIYSKARSIASFCFVKRLRKLIQPYAYPLLALFESVQ
jgi:ribonuclease HI